jgi:hypothetical protein
MFHVAFVLPYFGWDPEVLACGYFCHLLFIGCFQLQVLFLFEDAKVVAMEQHRMKRWYQSVSCLVAVELLSGRMGQGAKNM